MRAIFPLSPLLFAGAALGGFFAPFAVGDGPTDSIGVAAATERQLGPDVAVCHGSASAGVTGVMLRLAQKHTEVPQAEMQAASPAAAFADTDPPLWEGLGGVTYRITTANELAQSYFNQGLPLTYAFNHSEAQRAFRQAQKLDPDCAMCFWGEALVLGPNINLPMQVGRRGGAGLRGSREGAHARPQGDPARAGTDCGGLDPLRQGREGGPGAARCRLCVSHGEGRGAVSRRQRDRGALRRIGDGPQPVELLAARRPRTKPAKRPHHAHARTRP